MGRIERKISRDDKIFATLTHNGTRLANINGKNFGSVADVVKRIFSVTGRWLGVAVLSIRNYNQGWSIDLPLTFKSDEMPCDSRHSMLANGKGRQYVLPLFS